MQFGRITLRDAEGAILAHSLKHATGVFKKGRILSAEDVELLRAMDLDEVVAARLEADDVHEDAAAAALAAAIAGPGIRTTAAFTGRSNLIAEARGLLSVDHAVLMTLNSIDEALTVATLPPFAVLEPRQMVATIKIIPFAVSRRTLEAALAVARKATPLVRVAIFESRRVGLVQTRLEGMKEALFEKTKTAVDTRLSALGCAACEERRCAHDEGAVAEQVKDLRALGCDIVLVSGASAIVDRRDVVPAGIIEAGGQIDYFGMPVDPGNLILLAHLGTVPVIGLPGCARSPKLNGFDWILQRLLAGLPVDRSEIAAMGSGGLLKEIASRPLPRAMAVEADPVPARAPKVAALLLAAGQSRRMGSVNKLLAVVAGKAMVRHVAETLVASQAEPIIVVTGHQEDEVKAALSGLDLGFTHNPEFASGLASSLHRGVAALPEDCDAVLVCLGDMPMISPAVADKLIAAFDPLEGRAICLPTHKGKRGNPALLARRFFAEMQTLSGDIGARPLIAAYPELVCEVPVDNSAVLFDADTPEALEQLRRDETGS